MIVQADVQYAIEMPGVPAAAQFRRWVEAIPDAPDATVCIRLVDMAEMKQLNSRYRQIQKATNVLAFESDEEQRTRGQWGDLVICVPEVLREAQQYACSVEARFAHMTVHGLLHLLGYDHDKPEAAAQMEDAERTILGELGYSNPYEISP